MPRFKLILEYDGTPYCGWQWQEGHLSVQQVLEEAIEAFAGRKVRLHCAGRTDAGVHATHQVAHVDIAKPLRADVVRDAANAHLRPAPISVLSVKEVDENFSARLHAIRRHYLYRILPRRAPSALDQWRVWHVPWSLNPQAMQEAAQVLVGHHDFTTFRAGDCQAKSPVKTLERLDVVEAGAELHVVAASRSFLHHQVRSMVGTLMLAGYGKSDANDMRERLEARDRTRCGPMAPAHGLYLTGVDY